MRSSQFNESPPSKPQIKSKIRNGRCVHTDKVPMYKAKAEGFAAKRRADDRGAWSAYKCPYGKRHYHVGHIQINESKEVKE